MSRKPCLPFLLGSLLVITVLMFSAMPASIVRAQTASQTFRPTADAYVSQSSSGSNYGAKTAMSVDNAPLTRSYLRFTVSGLNGAAVQSAKLRPFANSSSSTGVTVRALANTTWAESSLTYTNAPAPGSAIKTSAAVAAGKWVVVDISSYVKAQGTYNLVLTTASSTNTSLAAREAGANAPQLVITTGTAAPTATAVPPPVVPPTAVPTTAATLPAPTATSPVVPTAAPTTVSWQPSFPIRAAFYYPWFAEAWTQQGIYPYTNYTPMPGLLQQQPTRISSRSTSR